MESLKQNQENLVQALENYVQNPETKIELLDLVNELNFDNNFKKIPLFENILCELSKSLEELSRKELKQRILLIKGFEY